MLSRVVLVRTTQLKIPEDGILHSHRYENLKSYIKTPARVQMVQFTPSPF
jgi:hypothetical protein